VNRRSFLKTALLAGGGAVAGPFVNRGAFRLFAQSDDSYSTRVLDLVAESTVVDMLGLLTLDWQKLRTWQRRPDSFDIAEFRRLQRSGVHVFHPAVDPAAKEPHAEALRWANDWSSLFRYYPRYFLRVDEARDLERPKRESQIGILLGLQNSDHFRKTADVATFHRLGQRVSQLTYSEGNALGSGCQDTIDEGLTDYGCAIVGEMNRVGMAVDVSHCSDRSSIEAMAVSKRPVLVTHSNCRALVAHPRCKPDSVIKLLARHGGVMGITAVRAFVSGRNAATLDDLLDHYQHVARIAGIEHVGIGSDCDLDPREAGSGQIRPAYAIRGLDHPRHVFDLAAGLLRRGFSDTDVSLVLGGNFRRALIEVWQPAAA
jgi:membrane dipeptidase